MDQFFINKNRINLNCNETMEIFMSDVIMEERCKKNLSVQIETNRNQENEIEKHADVVHNIIAKKIQTKSSLLK